MSGPRDTWAAGAAYEPFIGRWSRPVAAEFISWLAVPAGRRWLDVGCGTGALTELVLATGVPSQVVGIDPSPGFVRHAAAHVRDRRARFDVGSAAALPDGPFDVIVSGLVLNFVPDPAAALAAMRAAAPDGLIAAYVWDYAEGMGLLREFWDAAVRLDPEAAPLDEAVRFPLCQPEPLEHLWHQSGLHEVAVRAIEIPTLFGGFDDFWSPFLGGQGPAPSYVTGLSERRRSALREALRSRLGDGVIRMRARAWAVRGTAS
ncbi:MAG TPA: class I SAM-dependent methyltransferase [Sporichthya sp.]|nr:class I SAM-dependent methyltransferase [Sporichthya sp.]